MLLAPILVVGQASLSATVDAIASKALQEGPIAGMSVAIARRGKVVFAKGYGYANLELGVRATSNTVYHIDSISKHILASVVLRLAGQGKLSLSQPIGTYVKGCPDAWSIVTLRHLLSNTSGIPSFTDAPGFDKVERLDLSHSQVIDLVRNLPPSFGAGEGWEYSNTGSYLLGMAVENVTHRDYASYIGNALFVPLGMNASCYGDSQPLIKDRAAGYQVKAGKIVNADWISWQVPFAGGSICSTVLDLVKWSAALESGKVLGKPLLASMRGPTRLNDGASVDYGYFTRIGSLDGHALLGHTGSGAGFRNVLMHFPKDGLTVVVLTNSDTGSPSVVAAEVARHELGTTEVREDREVPERLLKKVPGVYATSQGPITFFARDRRLRFVEGATSSPKGGVPLLYRRDGTFAFDRSYVRFAFGKTSTWSELYIGGMFVEAAKKMN